MPANTNLFSFSKVYGASESLPCAVGTVHYQLGRKYVLAKNAGATTTAAGDVAGIYSTFAYGSVSVTAATIIDITDGTTIRPVIGGVCGGAAATGEYLWLWYFGYGTHPITTDGNVAANDLLTVTDGAIVATREVTAATAHRSPIGVAVAADVSTTLSSAWLKGDGIFPWGLGED